MQTRPYGSSGLQVPVLGFGAMQVGDPSLGDREAEDLLHRVLDAGLTLIDTARSYGRAEERIGRALVRRRDEYLLSTKVGYDIPGTSDWTYECVRKGVDAARDRLRTDVIDIVHLHSCPREVLVEGEVTRALHEARAAGKIRIVAYSGDAAALAYAVTAPGSAGEVARSVGEGPAFDGFQASVNLCDQQSLPTLQAARARGAGAIAKRSLAGRPWTGDFSGDHAHDEYRRRFARLGPAMALDPDDWDALALRFAAFAPGVDCVIVGGTRISNVERNLAAVRRGPLDGGELEAVARAYAACGAGWEGLV